MLSTRLREVRRCPLSLGRLCARGGRGPGKHAGSRAPPRDGPGLGRICKVSPLKQCLIRGNQGLSAGPPPLEGVAFHPSTWCPQPAAP